MQLHGHMGMAHPLELQYRAAALQQGMAQQGMALADMQALAQHAAQGGMQLPASMPGLAPNGIPPSNGQASHALLLL